MIYLDTSALVKYYVQEPGSDVVRRAVEDDPDPAFSVLAIVELASALWRKVREGGVEESEIANVLQRFLDDARHALVVPLVDGQGPVAQEAMRLCRDMGLKAADAVHLATALVLSARSTTTPLVFLAADRQLVQAARRSGLQALDPESSGLS